MGKIGENIYMDCYSRLERLVDGTEFALAMTIHGKELIQLHLDALESPVTLAHDSMIRKGERREDQIEKVKADLDKSQDAIYISVFQMIVSNWSYLEAFVYDLCCRWVVETKYQTVKLSLAKTKIPFHEFNSLNKDQCAARLIEEFERQNNLWGRNVVERFEAVLDAVGLGGTINKNLKKHLLEWSKIRNLIIHRAGIVDEKFLQDCPWIRKSKKGNFLKAKVGRMILIAPEDYECYRKAAFEYAKIIETRFEAALESIS